MTRDWLGAVINSLFDENQDYDINCLQKIFADAYGRGGGTREDTVRNWDIHHRVDKDFTLAAFEVLKEYDL